MFRKTLCLGSKGIAKINKHGMSRLRLNFYDEHLLCWVGGMVPCTVLAGHLCVTWA